MYEKLRKKEIKSLLTKNFVDCKRFQLYPLTAATRNQDRQQLPELVMNTELLG